MNRVVGVPLETFLKHLFWLAYEASVSFAGPSQIRVAQMMERTRGQGPDMEMVWKNVCTAGDYPSGHLHLMRDGLSADYVFGRMMKLSVRVKDDKFEINRGEAPRSDYQSWALIYPTVESLLEATAKLLECEVTHVQ